MSSVSQVEQAMQNVFAQAESLARTSGFVQRASKLTGKVFAQTLVLSWWNNPHASREDLARMAASLGVQITAQGLDERLGERAVPFLWNVLECGMEQVISADPVAIPLLQRFSAVIVLDSSTIQLPDALKEIWRGNGGKSQNGTQAAMKVHVGFDLLAGGLRVSEISDGRCHDSASVQQSASLPSGGLRITDLGYFKLDVFAQLEREGSYFLSRLDGHSAIYDEQGSRLDLLLWLREQTQSIDVPIQLGQKHRLPCRLLALRVPAEVAEQRRSKVRKATADRGKPISEHTLALCEWTLLISNAPANLLNLQEALVLARARWQIELLFKLWKHYGALDDWCSSKPAVILCEIYAKLIALLFQHWLILLSCWQEPSRSLVKIAATVRTWVPVFSLAYRGLLDVSLLLHHLQEVLAGAGRLNARRKHPNTSQFLLGQDLPYPGLA